jgi:protein O-mannosyl-transferase
VSSPRLHPKTFRSSHIIFFSESSRVIRTDYKSTRAKHPSFRRASIKFYNDFSHPDGVQFGKREKAVLSSAAVQLERKETASQAKGPLGSSQKRKVIFCLLLAMVTLAAYNPVAHSGFVFLDDVPYILNNPPVRAGLTWATVKWSFTSVHAGYWHPLTWLSHALDCQLFGLNPAGHHYVSLLFHTANAILLFLLLLEATGATWASLMVAALFALHPENVESVAWAAERKNVLSMFFFLLALWAYGRYARSGGVRRYTTVVVFFALGLLAKPQIVTLPCVLLLWDYWPLRRMFAAPGDANVGGVVPRSLSYLVLEKLPLFVLVALSSAITFWSQRVGSAVRTLAEFSLSARLQNAVVSYVRYLANTFWPVRLAPMYPHPGNSLPAGQVILSAALLLLLTAVVIRWRDRRYLPVGWLWFLGTLVPMIGIVQVGEQAMADRFIYIPIIGLLIALVWAFAEEAEEKNISPTWLAVPALLALATLAALTYHQLAYWHDGETLWRYTLSVTRNNYQAHESLAMVLDQQGRTEEAIPEFQAAESVHSYPLDQVLSLGVYEQRNGHVQGAIEQYKKVVDGSSDSKLRAGALAQMGSAYCQMKDYEQARQSYERALQLNPDEAGALVGSGMLARRSGNASLAVRQFSRAVKIEPTDVGLLFLADALREAGQSDEAQAAEQVAQKTSSDFAAARKSVDQTYRFFGINSVPAAAGAR